MKNENFKIIELCRGKDLFRIFIICINILDYREIFYTFQFREFLCKHIVSHYLQSHAGDSYRVVYDTSRELFQEN